MAASRRSDFKLPRYDPISETIKYICIIAEDKKPGYIPIGAAITAYSRRYTIKAAQLNYHGPNDPGFIYADTDSIHCNLAPEEVKGVELHDTKLGAWKVETKWDEAVFHRQKTYIEREDNKYIIRCAGMPETCKELFEIGLWTGLYKLSDFSTGLKLEGKLMPKRIKGGIILCESVFEMKF